MKFTGHERDLCCDGVNTPVDYMHARYYGPTMGRFLSVDPGKDWEPKQPQSWNMYSYVRNGPMVKTDPTGKWVLDSAWDTLNIVIGVRAFVSNVAAGNYAAAALDALGVGIDVGSLASPTPGGAGTAIKLARQADKLDDAADLAKSSRYRNVTQTSRSQMNRATNVTPAEFGKNLEAQGFKKTTSSDGKALVYEKNGNKYVIYPQAKSTKGPTAAYSAEGTPIVKIRLDDARK